MRRRMMLFCVPMAMLLAGCVSVVTSCLLTVAVSIALQHVLWSASVVSLRPLWNADVAAKDGRIEGRWVLDDDPEGSVWTVTSAGPAYELKASGAGNPDVESYSAGLAKIGESFYMDLQPRPANAGALSIQTHLIFRLEFDGEKLSLAFLDRAKLVSFLGEGGSPLSAEEVDSRLVLTSKTPALQGFLQAHGPDINGGIAFRLRRK